MNVWNYSIIVNWGEIRAWSPRRTNYPKFGHQYLIINVKHVIYFLQLTKILFTQQNIYYLSCPLNFDETKNYGITTGQTHNLHEIRVRHFTMVNWEKKNSDHDLSEGTHKFLKSINPYLYLRQFSLLVCTTPSNMCFPICMVGLKINGVAIGLFTFIVWGVQPFSGKTNPIRLGKLDISDVF